MDRRGLLNDPVETNLLILDGRQSGMWTALPCIVTKVNFSQMTIEAQPAIKGVNYDQNNNATYVNLPLIADVPLVFPSAGDFMITLPIAAGDEVLVVFASRCIDDWWQSSQIGMPIEMRMHDLSDGFAIPGPKSVPNVFPGISTTDLQIRNKAGTSFISLGADGNVKITAPLTTIDGNLVVTGEVTGGATSIPLTTHIHPGVQSGGSDTGAPLP